MKEGMIYQALIELIDAWLQSKSPFDVLLTRWLKAHRSFGAYERRHLSRKSYELWDHWATILWIGQLWQRQEPSLQLNGRMYLLIFLKLKGDIKKVADLFNGRSNHPSSLTSQEKNVLRTDLPDLKKAPSWVKSNVPEWAYYALAAHQKEGFIETLGQEPPVDLRVNTLKTFRAQVQNWFKHHGVILEPTPLSPWGLRSRERIPFGEFSIFQEGWFDIQDEGSQLVALLCDVKPGDHVLDLCAGAGGKTLALACAMENRGQLYACDTSLQRLERARVRLKRAGVMNVQCFPLKQDVPSQLRQRKMDVVLVDAPCTGSGTWRRNPDQRWRLDQEALGRIAAQQRDILQKASNFVASGGRLVYATCSIFPEENQAIVEQFLASNKHFSWESCRRMWNEILKGKRYPGDDDPWLQLWPHVHETDGFFVAVLHRD